MTLEEFDHEDRRRFYARAIAEVKVFPRSQPNRLKLRWTGSEDDVVVTEPKGDPKTLAILQAAASQEQVIADLEKAAAQGDQSAKDYLAAKKAAAV